jgi:hypothetical protein
MRSLILRVAILGLVPTASGCILPFNGPSGVRRDIQAATGREYDRSFALTVGRSGVALARWAVRKAGEDDIPLEGLRKVEIGIYEVRDRSDQPSTGSDFTAILWPTWRPLVEMHPDQGENVLILSEARSDGSIKRLLFLVENEDQLVIVRLKGRLDHFIEQAMRYAFEQADRPDLIDPSIEEYRRGAEVHGDQEPAPAEES